MQPTFNGRQRLVLCFSLACALLAGSFPPWTYTSDFRIGDDLAEHAERPAGFAFITAPPDPAANRFLLVAGSKIHRYDFLGAGVRVDVGRLAAEFSALSVATALAMLALRKPAREPLATVRAVPSAVTTTRSYDPPVYVQPAVAPTGATPVTPRRPRWEPSLLRGAGFAPAWWCTPALAALVFTIARWPAESIPTWGGLLGTAIGLAVGSFGPCAAMSLLLAFAAWRVTHRRAVVLVAWVIGSAVTTELAIAGGARVDQFEAFPRPSEAAAVTSQAPSRGDAFDLTPVPTAAHRPIDSFDQFKAGAARGDAFDPAALPTRQPPADLLAPLTPASLAAATYRMHLRFYYAGLGSYDQDRITGAFDNLVAHGITPDVDLLFAPYPAYPVPGESPAPPAPSAGQ